MLRIINSLEERLSRGASGATHLRYIEKAMKEIDHVCFVAGTSPSQREELLGHLNALKDGLRR